MHTHLAMCPSCGHPITSSARHRLAAFELGRFFTLVQKRSCISRSVRACLEDFIPFKMKAHNHTCCGEGRKALRQEFPWKDTLWIPQPPALPLVMSPAGCFRASSLACCASPRGSDCACLLRQYLPARLHWLFWLHLTRAEKAPEKHAEDSSFPQCQQFYAGLEIKCEKCLWKQTHHFRWCEKYALPWCHNTCICFSCT